MPAAPPRAGWADDTDFSIELPPQLLISPPILPPPRPTQFEYGCRGSPILGVIGDPLSGPGGWGLGATLDIPPLLSPQTKLIKRLSTKLVLRMRSSKLEHRSRFLVSVL